MVQAKPFKLMTWCTALSVINRQLEQRYGFSFGVKSNTSNNNLKKEGEFNTIQQLYCVSAFVTI